VGAKESGGRGKNGGTWAREAEGIQEKEWCKKGVKRPDHRREGEESPKPTENVQKKGVKGGRTGLGGDPITQSKNKRDAPEKK